ncbi:nuclear pore complex protein NUP160 isoform X2 [Corylus avellana]|uniref:nuclear pore complex protein NUP160 isoform X2 n=1 Tax=Corylus avellana TaxID=13451 RepID=UPI00286ACA0D|nr:nuclear pore complex protein NUP160 isoform X2 [Corylus avellana]
MGIGSTLGGMEVPIIGSDSVKWVEVSVPSFSSSSSSAVASSPPFAPLTEDYASSSGVKDSSIHLIWKIHKALPHALELLELSANKEFPMVGLRITFPDALSPFAFVCQNQITYSARHPYLLYALTVSGVVYLLKLRNISTYASSSVFPSDELIEFDVHTYSNHGAITTVAATAGCFAVGFNDGSVSCFQLGILDQSAPGFVHELRDDSGIGRLWGIISRGRIVGAVQDLLVCEVHGKQLLFVLHSDGILRVWDCTNYGRIFSHTMSSPELAGATVKRLWVAQADNDSSVIPLAILYSQTLEASMEMIYVYGLHCSFSDRTVLTLEPSVQNLPLEEGRCIDVKLTSDKIWILKDNGLVFHNLLHPTVTVEEPQCYALQEEFVADQLFQSSEHSSDNLLWITHSLFSSGKDHTVPFVSSIFLRRLLCPGVHHNISLRATLLDYNRHWTDSEFHSLTADGLKKEILSLIETEGSTENSSIFYCWKNFCTRYFHNWCKNNAPCGLLLDSSSGAIGLIRKNSLAFLRCLEDIERLVIGSSDEHGDPVSFGLDLFDDDLASEILMEMLRCVISISQQLGKTASAIFYESLVSTSVVPSEEIIHCIMKILVIGYSSSAAMLHVSDTGADIAWEKKLADHKNIRKFSIDMLLSLHALREKAVTWARVLNVIESFLKFLVPRKIIHNFDAEISSSINASILVQATSQISKVMFESALDMLLFLNYLVKISGQIHMLHDDISRIQLELVPMIEEIVSEWLVVHFFANTPSQPAAIEDFSSQLSSLQIDSNMSKRSWNEKLGKCHFTLAFILLHNIQSSSGDHSNLSSKCLPSSHDVINSMHDFTSWIIWGKSGESSAFLSHSTELALILLRHGQYDAIEYLLTTVEAHLRKEKTSQSIQDTDGRWCILHHLLGCCLLAQARSTSHGMLKEKKVNEAVRCFFRASSGKGASQALQSLSHEVGFPHLGSLGCVSDAAWKVHYYQWAMQIFEQYNISEGACQFALAALEQVDEALSPKGHYYGRDPFSESTATIKGRLWANVFKFTLDLNRFYDAYCAIITNPDEESKYICLRRFIIVLYECGAMKILCGGQLPFIGLSDKVEQELAWKAERSDILAKPNLYKLLYAFEMHRHNWRRAAGYIYLYSARLRTEAALKDYLHTSLVLQERLNGLSAAINALYLVHPVYAWIDPLLEGNSLHNEHYPRKKARTMEEQTSNDVQPQRSQSYVDIEKLENEFVLTSAEYLLSLASVKWTFTVHKAPSDLVDLLVQKNLYDMAFTVLLKFFKGSALKRELERVFSAMSLKCCQNKVDSSCVREDVRTHGLLLMSSKTEMVVHGSPDVVPAAQQSKGNSQWETLELYLEKYRGFHAKLPVIVAETFLSADPHIELPLWLVQMFKDGRRERMWGMTGKESNPASLFQLYVDYGRYTEATNLLLDYIESFASARPADIINRKRPSAVWFPYTAIERLCCQLEEFISCGRMVDHCEKLRKLLHGALQKHLQLLRVDSDDAPSAVH